MCIAQGEVVEIFFTVNEYGSENQGTNVIDSRLYRVDISEDDAIVATQTQEYTATGQTGARVYSTFTRRQCNKPAGCTYKGTVSVTADNSADSFITIPDAGWSFGGKVYPSTYANFDNGFSATCSNSH